MHEWKDAYMQTLGRRGEERRGEERRGEERRRGGEEPLVSKTKVCVCGGGGYWYKKEVEISLLFWAELWHVQLCRFRFVMYSSRSSIPPPSLLSPPLFPCTSSFAPLTSAPLSKRLHSRLLLLLLLLPLYLCVCEAESTILHPTPFLPLHCPSSSLSSSQNSLLI